MTRAYLGVQAQSVTPAVAATAGLSRVDGMLVARVVAGGPAARAGLQPNDVLVALGDVPIAGQQDLQQALTGRFKPGETVAVRIDRGGTEQTVTVTLGEPPAS